MSSESESFINAAAIENSLAHARSAEPSRVREILARATELHGLDDTDVAILTGVTDADLLDEMFRTARQVKESLYGRRIVLFAPLYVSNYCRNDCVYCAFRVRNRGIVRRRLNQAEIAAEVRALEDQGHKRLLLVAGEAFPEGGIDYILESIDTIYGVHSGAGEIRRINVNIAPLSQPEFARLKEAKIGTYQLFQETYHEPTYAAVHLAGRKRDYHWRLGAMDRAMQAGIDDVGIGALFGLYDWRFELLALMHHARHLEERYGCGPHTISVPRLETAAGADFSGVERHRVSDEDFRKIIAILRLAVPYTGIILSTRESPAMRHDAISLGVSQISAGSRTDPGGYSESGDEACGQFQLGDHRPLAEVIRELAGMGFIPSFCTACYRLGRTGVDFMDLAKPGEIKYHCDPNALSTLREYLNDYADDETRFQGERLIEKTLADMDARQREISARLLQRVAAGHRDQYC
jgi:2-iminoacetate synthase